MIQSKDDIPDLKNQQINYMTGCDGVYASRINHNSSVYADLTMWNSTNEELKSIVESCMMLLDVSDDHSCYNGIIKKLCMIFGSLIAVSLKTYIGEVLSSQKMRHNDLKEIFEYMLKFKNSKKVIKKVLNVCLFSSIHTRKLKLVKYFREDIDLKFGFNLLPGLEYSYDCDGAKRKCCGGHYTALDLSIVQGTHDIVCYLVQNGWDGLKVLTSAMVTAASSNSIEDLIFMSMIMERQGIETILDNSGEIHFILFSLEGAIINNKMDIVRYILGEYPEITMIHMREIMSILIKYENVDILELVYSYNPAYIRRKRNDLCYSALIGNSLQTLQFLEDKGIFLSQDDKDMHLFRVCVYEKNKIAIKYLLEKGAIFNQYGFYKEKIQIDSDNNSSSNIKDLLEVTSAVEILNYRRDYDLLFHIFDVIKSGNTMINDFVLHDYKINLLAIAIKDHNLEMVKKIKQTYNVGFDNSHVIETVIQNFDQSIIQYLIESELTLIVKISLETIRKNEVQFFEKVLVDRLMKHCYCDHYGYDNSFFQNIMNEIFESDNIQIFKLIIENKEMTMDRFNVYTPHLLNDINHYGSVKCLKFLIGEKNLNSICSTDCYDEYGNEMTSDKPIEEILIKFVKRTPNKNSSKILRFLIRVGKIGPETICLPDIWKFKLGILKDNLIEKRKIGLRCFVSMKKIQPNEHYLIVTEQDMENKENETIICKSVFYSLFNSLFNLEQYTKENYIDNTVMKHRIKLDDVKVYQNC